MLLNNVAAVDDEKYNKEVTKNNTKRPGCCGAGRHVLCKLSIYWIRLPGVAEPELCKGEKLARRV